MFFVEKPSFKGFIALLLLLLLAMPAHAFWPWNDGAQIDADEVVTFFPTEGYFDAERNRWLLNIEGWIYEPEESAAKRDAVRRAYEGFTGEAVADPAEFWERMKGFVVDNESMERVVIRLGPNEYPLPESGGGGRITGTIALTTGEAARLAPDADGWVTFAATADDGRIFQGRCRMIGQGGISVISDIDDTVKVTEVYAGTLQMVKNTFNRPFALTPGIQALFAALESEGAVFHYLSGSPWQLQAALGDFFAGTNLPEGTFRMKEFRINPTSEAFWNFVEPGTTIPLKKAHIQRLITEYPSREFILVGDSGEHDPEIYAWAAETYPRAIRKIYIRHVPNKEAGPQTMAEIMAKFGAHGAKVSFIEMDTGLIVTP